MELVIHVMIISNGIQQVRTLHPVYTYLQRGYPILTYRGVSPGVLAAITHAW